MKAAISNSLFPAFGSLMHNVGFRYPDNVFHEPHFMCGLIGPTTAGETKKLPDSIRQFLLCIGAGLEAAEHLLCFASGLDSSKLFLILHHDLLEITQACTCRDEVTEDNVLLHALKII